MMYKIKLKDLKEYDDLFYVGDLVTVDGNGWVNKQEALEIIEMLNAGPEPVIEDWDLDDFTLNEEF